MTLNEFSVIVARLRAAGCVFADDEARLVIDAARTPAQLAALVERRAAGEPLEHILGWAEFCGLRIAVDAGVFVPRRRTEFLVREAAAVAPSGAVVVDLCCGSGAVGTALASVLESGVDLHAVDIDPAAVRCARRNVVAFGGWVYEGDLFDALPDGLRGRVDVLVANVPYVPTDAIVTMPLEARLHEPRVALDGGTDGLDVHRRVVAGAAHWLAPGGHVLVETSEEQAADLVNVFAGKGFASWVARSEGRGATVVVATCPDAGG